MRNLGRRESMDLCAYISTHRTFIMGMMMIAIVMFHLKLYLLVCYPLNNFGHWGVDVFQFVSGFGCVYAFKKKSDVIYFYRKRLLRLLPTCLLIGSTLMLVHYGIHHDVKLDVSIFAQLLSLDKWYIRLIIVSYLLFPLFYALLRAYAIKGVLVAMFLSIPLGMFIPTVGIWNWYGIFFRIPAFVIGIYIALYNPRLNIFKIMASACCIVIAVGILQWGEESFLSVLPGLIWTIPLALALPVIALIFSMVGETIKCHRVSKCIEIVGLYSLEIYLIHEFIIVEVMSICSGALMQLCLFISCVVCGACLAKYMGNKIIAIWR